MASLLWTLLAAALKRAKLVIHLPFSIWLIEVQYLCPTSPQACSAVADVGLVLPVADCRIELILVPNEVKHF